MSRRTHAVALWLAACALAARAQAERVKCTHPNCTWFRTDGEYDFYVINGESNTIQITDENVKYVRTCSRSVALDNPAWPRFPNPKNFEYIELYGCAPPTSTSYAAALGALNVPVNRNLILINIPSDARISAASLADMPNLEYLNLRVPLGAPVLELEPGALAAFEELYSLELEHVRTDQLPRNVSKLSLIQVGTLPPGAFDVDSLEIDDDEITSINATAPRIRHLRLFSKSLVSLVLYNTSYYLERVELESCPAIETLELHYAHALGLSADLLPNAMSLKYFTYTNTEITTLPLGLFSHSPHLQVINLSKNKLDSLPREVFSGLSELLALRLNDNRLSIQELRAVSPLSSLRALDVSGNPLGDLCSAEVASGLTQLQHLQELSLARIGAPRVCAGWLGELHALLFLDLHGNNVRNISCGELRAPLYPGTNFTVVGLQKNPLEQFYCSLDDKKDFGSSKPRQIVLVTKSVDKCNCDCPFVKCVPDPTLARDIILPSATVPDEATTAAAELDVTTSAATNLDETTLAATALDVTISASSDLDVTTSAATTLDETTSAATALDETTSAVSDLDETTWSATTLDETNSPSGTPRQPLHDYPRIFNIKLTHVVNASEATPSTDDTLHLQ